MRENGWNLFLKKNGGKGFTKEELKKKYCREKLTSKIRINMEEYKRGRWLNRAQAIAVSYSQTQKKYPECKNVLKRK